MKKLDFKMEGLGVHDLLFLQEFKYLFRISLRGNRIAEFDFQDFQDLLTLDLQDNRIE